jgi:hypothetical protein
VTSIWGDPVLEQSTVIILEGLDQSTVIILESSVAKQLAGTTLPADFGHGTMVASLIAAAAPNAQILPIRAFNADGTANLSDIEAAIFYAVNNGAQVINMSFDVSMNDPTLAAAIAYANSQGVVCVASAANQNANVLAYPAAYAGQVVGVGSVDSFTGLFKSGFSAYGQPSVDVYAPGESMIAAFPGGNYAVASGTSFSAALASGAAATLISAKSTAVGNYDKALTTTGPKILYPADGTRRIDLKAALNGLD